MDHNATCAIWNAQKELIVVLEEEKHSRKKMASIPMVILNSTLKYLEPNSTLIIDWGKIDFRYYASECKLFSGKTHDYNFYIYEFFEKQGFTIKNKLKSLADVNYKFLFHHENHAYSSYYQTNFDKALVFTYDGGGSENYSNKIYGDVVTIQENECVFLFEDDKLKRTLFKNYTLFMETANRLDKQKVERVTEYINNNLHIVKNRAEENNFTVDRPIGFCYTHYGIRCNVGRAGKMMGLAAYGKLDKTKKNPLRIGDRTEHHFDEILLEYTSSDLACRIQYETTKLIEERVRTYIEKFPDVKNICFGGGVTLNIISNANLVNKFPNHNFFFDPTCGDEGTAFGTFHRLYGGPRRINETLYFGEEFNDNEIMGILDRYDTIYEKRSRKQIAEALTSDKIVAYFAKGTEIGPRALGGRSLLMSPLKKENHLKMNEAKGRESWRPTACIVLEEFAHEYFDIDLRYSGTMMLSFEAKDKAKEEVPMVVHADNTCRVQTLNKEQNPQLYELIYEFYKMTGCPIVSNTSFNNAGEAMVNDPKQALDTFYEGDYNILYFGDYGITVEK